MPQHKKFIKNTLIYTIGNFGSNVFRFLIFPLYTFFLTKADVGTYDLYITSITLLVPIFSLQLGDAAYRWLLEVKQDTSNVQTIVSTNVMFLIVSIVAALLLLLALLFFTNLQYSIYLVVILIATIIFKLCQQIARGLGKNRLYAAGGILNTVFLLVFNVLFLVIFKWSIDGVFLATLLGYSFASLFLIIRLKLKYVFRADKFSFFELKRMVAYSWPLIPNTISWWVINASDKYLILYFLTIDDNGIYSISNKIPAIMLAINSIFSLAWQDHMIEDKLESNKNNEAVSNSLMLNKFIVFELSIAFVLISASSVITQLIVSPSFFPSWHYMPLLILGVVYMSFSSFLGASYLKMKNTKSIFYTSILSGAINITISILLIPKIGLYAPALGSAVSFIVMFVIRSYQVREYFKISIYIKSLITLTIIAIALISLALLNIEMVTNLSIAFSIILFFSINRKDLAYLIKKIPFKPISYK